MANIETSEKPISERVQHIRPSLIALVFRVAILLLLTEAVYGLILAMGLYVFFNSSYPLNLPGFIWWINAGKFVFEIIVVVTSLRTQAVNYYLVNHELARFSGWVHFDENVYDLRNLQTAKVGQSWLGRLFDYGDIYLTLTAAGYTQHVWMFAVQEPKKHEALISQFVFVDRLLVPVKEAVQAIAADETKKEEGIPDEAASETEIEQSPK